jgi:hypothetical protein
VAADRYHRATKRSGGGGVEGLAAVVNKDNTGGRVLNCYRGTSGRDEGDGGCRLGEKGRHAAV